VNKPFARGVLEVTVVERPAGDDSGHSGHSGQDEFLMVVCCPVTYIYESIKIEPNVYAALRGFLEQCDLMQPEE